jgi:hypothetical protein
MVRRASGTTEAYQRKVGLVSELPDNIDDAILWVIDEIWLGGGATTVDIRRELLDDFNPTKDQVRRRLASMVKRGVLESGDHIDYQYHEKRERWCWTPCKVYSRPGE